ncbi:sarcosine oxidase subunit gamma family protein [Shimia thalassica]|uniref:sarcosine oxidase subunit gamma n=1 Tax=Shimia thalassica TaxID=1715693 RepID=UPI001C09E3FC|nr:sarcosine oxidase subunit gamma family protein [Shimia thalassica]MBU2941848.1 sarcosine oxidase subunit gamma [Shimia thalassica]MDO6503770.1 sarcosine oxidase subunit gamma family protein [Shimia thalassica]
MSNVVSALAGVSHAGFAKVEETGLNGMITVRGDLDSSEMAAAVKAATGASVPAIRKIAAGDKGRVAWMSPDELLVIVAYDDVADTMAALNDALSGVHALVANVSDARAVFRISGDNTREVLAKVSPVDLSSEAFGAGDFRRSRIAQVAAAFWMNDDNSFEVVCFRSVAQYVFDVLRVSSDKGGEVGFFS